MQNGYSGPMRATFSAELEPIIPENLSHFFNLVRVHSGQLEPLCEKADTDIPA